MSVSVFIDGAAGTTGLEIRERLATRSDISLIGLDDAHRKDAGKRAEAINSADFVILCLPDDAAREAVALIANDTTRVIDASTAHRVAYGWTYGFAELEPAQAAAIAEARYVSNPGCWPTGFLALVRPLVRAGLIPPDWVLTAGGASGYSGGGKSMIAEFEDGSEPTGFRAYGLNLEHKHLPEMQKRLSRFADRPRPAQRRRLAGADRGRCRHRSPDHSRVRQCRARPGTTRRHARQSGQGRGRRRGSEPEHHGRVRPDRRTGALGRSGLLL